MDIDSQQFQKKRITAANLYEVKALASVENSEVALNQDSTWKEPLTQWDLLNLYYQNQPERHADVANLHYIDTKSLDVMQIPSAVTPHQLNVVVQGDDETGRTGNRIVMRYLDLSFQVYNLAKSITSAARVVVVYDDDGTNGTAPAWNVVMATNTIYSLNNAKNVARFKILYDSNLIGMDTNMKAGYSHRCRVPIKMLGDYEDSVGINMSHGTIWLYEGCSDSTLQPTLGWHSRIWYFTI